MVIWSLLFLELFTLLFKHDSSLALADPNDFSSEKMKLTFRCGREYLAPVLHSRVETIAVGTEVHSRHVGVKAFLKILEHGAERDQAFGVQRIGYHAVAHVFEHRARFRDLFSRSNLLRRRESGRNYTSRVEKKVL